VTVTATPIFPQTITSPSVQILPATTTGLVTLYTAGTNGSKIENIIVSNTDSGAAYALTLTVVTSATSYIIGTINVPLSAGNTTAAPAISLINSTNIPLAKDANGNPYIYLASGSVLKVNSGTTVTTAKVLSITAMGGDY
jgi:hypothetical protein